MNIASQTPSESMRINRIFQSWWPLAASWLLMGAELPILSAVVARLANPEINLAAYGGVVFPLALIIESPIIMLLAASTALSKDWNSYRKLHRFMLSASMGLTVLHILVAFTPLYYFVVRGMLGAPPEIIEPARIGLKIMTPWTWSIAYRRFNQGVLIRFNHSKAISLGTFVRLTTDIAVLSIGYFVKTFPGIIVATSAVASGVISEAIFVGIVVRPVIRNQLQTAPQVAQAITLKSFLDFYIPLAMTSLLLLLVQPLGSAAMGRMPQALNSLAVWPVVSGLVFMLRSLGMAYNEVVVAVLDESGSFQSLERFTRILAMGTSFLLFLIAVSPISDIWFSQVQGLNPTLTQLASRSLWIALAIPGINVLQSWYQGSLVHGRRTREITESVVIFLITCTIILGAGIAYGHVTGLYISLAAYGTAMTTQTLWLWFRSRPVLHAVYHYQLNK